MRDIWQKNGLPIFRAKIWLRLRCLQNKTDQQELRRLQVLCAAGLALVAAAAAATHVTAAATHVAAAATHVAAAARTSTSSGSSRLGRRRKST